MDFNKVNDWVLCRVLPRGVGSSQKFQNCIVFSQAARCSIVWYFNNFLFKKYHYTFHFWNWTLHAIQIQFEFGSYTSCNSFLWQGRVNFLSVHKKQLPFQYIVALLYVLKFWKNLWPNICIYLNFHRLQF